MLRNSTTSSSSSSIGARNYHFRRANAGDMPKVQQMIQELADFENMSDGPQLEVTDLIRDAGLNGQQEVCHIYVLDLITENSNDVIGYAICYFAYSTWQGKCYFIEDIYVKPDYRNMGGGCYMFHEIARIAQRYHCKRIDFHVLSWNPARRFYARMGAVDLTDTENWHLYRLNEQQIDQLLQQFHK